MRCVIELLSVQNVNAIESGPVTMAIEVNRRYLMAHVTLDS